MLYKCTLLHYAMFVHYCHACIEPGPNKTFVPELNVFKLEHGRQQVIVFPSHFFGRLKLIRSSI